MILTTEEIKDIIDVPQNEYIPDYKTEYERMSVLVSGGDVASLIEQVKGYENLDKRKLRENVARSTKDVVGYLLKPTQKIFTAAGFYREYVGTSKGVKDAIEKYLEMLPQGVSLRKWMQDYWMEAFITDPNGVILIERNDDGDSYPVYKSISVIHDYQHEWGKFDYLVLDYGERELEGDYDIPRVVKVYRVIDDEKDALFYLGNEGELVEYSSETEPHDMGNPAGEVPALLVSDIMDMKTDGRRGFLHSVDELLKECLRDTSVLSIYKFLHGFPIFWAYAMDCTTCEGEGVIANPRFNDQLPVSDQNPERITCTTCHGTRLQTTKDVSDGVRLPLPRGEGDPVLAPNIAGYIQPDLDTWKKMEDTINQMKRDMHFGVWGTHVEDEKSNTATGRYIDAQPVNDTLRVVSDMAERKEQQILEYIAALQFKSVKKEGIKVTYGKRFMIETPDVLWERYLEAKEKKAPISSLDYMYTRFLQGEYFGDAQLLDQKMKEFYLEPFPHYTLGDLKGIASAKQMQEKLLYSDWVEQADFAKDLSVLKAEFKAFVEKYIEENKPEEAPAGQEGGGTPNPGAPGMGPDPRVIT